MEIIIKMNLQIITSVLSKFPIDTLTAVFTAIPPLVSLMIEFIIIVAGVGWKYRQHCSGGSRGGSGGSLESPL